MKRRKSHRSIEQKRRDHINSGIDELAKLIPGPQRSKGKTVHRAAAYLKHVEECQERFNEQGMRTDGDRPYGALSQDAFAHARMTLGVRARAEGDFE